LLEKYGSLISRFGFDIYFAEKDIL